MGMSPRAGCLRTAGVTTRRAVRRPASRHELLLRARPLRLRGNCTPGGALLTTWVGRYAIVRGEVREHGPSLIDRVRRREDETLRLIVLTEPVDERSAEFCHEVAEAIAALFSREALSITGGLLRALRQANTNLAEWNRRSLREHRVAVGVTAVVVRDGEATIAQTGPGTVYVRTSQTVTRLTTEGQPGATALGVQDEIEPLFTSASLTTAQVLLLSGAAEAAVGGRIVHEALDAGPERALAELFRHTREVRDMTAVLVADLDIDEEQAAPSLDEWEDGEAVEGREIAFGDLDSGPPPPLPVERPRGWRVLPDSGERSRLPSIKRTRVAGGRGQPAMLPWRTVGGIVAGAVLLVAVAWAVLPGLLREDRAAELEAAITQAQAQIAAAETAARIEEQRAALQAALAEAERARALAPDDPRIEAITADAVARLAVLDAITPVEALTPVLTFEGTITAPVTPEELVAGGRALWLRESGRGRVIRIDPAGGEPSEVYRTGEQYGGSMARDPAAIAWDASTARLLVLDAGRTLFAIADEPGAEPVPLPIRDAVEMRSIVSIAVYLGNLYLLDPASGEVWRYLPASEGFDSERSGTLGGQEIDGATDLAVDGDVFVLDDGTLRRFSQGREQVPMLDGLDQAVQSAEGLVQDVLRGLFYIADRGERRVVVGDRAGLFVRQYRHADFTDLRGLAVAPDGQRVYVLSGSGIVSFPVQPRAATTP